MYVSFGEANRPESDMLLAVVVESLVDAPSDLAVIIATVLADQ